MKEKFRLYRCIESVLLLALLFGGSNSCQPVDRRQLLFEEMSPEQCGIRFRNDVADDSIFNEFTYRNFYNGGGVAIGDLNNDGLPEVFMTANQGRNKLFKNNGNFSFSDVTDAAGIVKKSGWNTGVTMADVNADGLLDIYICAAGIAKNDKRENELYINLGNLRFEQQAEKYNLTDAGSYHTQASFFDYDHDGDLDVYLLNNSYSFPVSIIGIKGMRSRPSSYGGGHKLMRNDTGTFTDVTAAAGIYGSDISFGLGVSIGDINNDTWPDLYVSNDFFEKDCLYINQQNGTFKELSDEYLPHMSQSSMGADIADINNDGRMDIFTTDMLPEDDYRLKKNTRFDDFDTYTARTKAGFHRQILSNMLHVNNGDNTFCETAQYSGVNATDWSWGALIFDMNNDGLKDIFVCNGMYLDATDQDYVDYTANENRRNLFNPNKKPVDYEMLKKLMASKPIANYAFINKGNLSFVNESNSNGLGKPGYSNGAAYGDLDDDGDLDIVVNNINSDCFVYRNNSHQKYFKVAFEGPAGNRFGVGAKVTVYAGGTVQRSENFPARGFQSAVEPKLLFGLGDLEKIDSVEVVWPNGARELLQNVQLNNEVVVKIVNAKNNFQAAHLSGKPLFTDVTESSITGNILHRENEFTDFDRQRLMPRMLSTEGPTLCKGDVNNDGLIDFFVGSSKHDTSKLFLQDRNGGFRQSHQQAFADDKAYEDGGSVMFDADRDGDDDLVISSAGNLEQEGSALLRVRFFRNDSGVFVKDTGVLPDVRVNATVVLNLDFDSDGDDDLFVGGRCVTADYGAAPRSYLLRNDRGAFSDATDIMASELKHVGMVTDAVFESLDGDHSKELVIVGEWMPVSVFKFDSGKFISAFANQFRLTNGWWNCINASDIDNDGDFDLVAGNYGLNSKFRADSLHPVRVYVNDFDNSGSTEPIVAVYKKEKSYPYYLRGDLTSQIPSLKKKYLKYVDYAGKTMEDIFDASLLENSLVREVHLLATCLFLNNGKSGFTRINLPLEAQLAPVFSIHVGDMTGDGLKDIFLVGNFCGLKPELGRMDANTGTLLKGKGKGKFDFLPPSESGLFYKGEGRSLLSIETTDNKHTLILSRNNEKLKLYKSTSN